jgi:hypothetical protein
VNQQNQSLPQHAKPSNQQAAPAAMQVLTATELREVVGGPVINNGDAIATQSASSSQG